MRLRITFVLALSVMVSQAQKIELLYIKTIDPFRWTIHSIEFTPDVTVLDVTAKNVAEDTRFISFEDGEYLYSEKCPNGVKSIHNSVITNASTKRVFLSPNDEVSFKLAFSTKQALVDRVFSLKVCSYFTLTDIIVNMSLADVKKMLMVTWEQYYNAHRIHKVSYNNIDDLKTSIQSDVENWQKKGEFESSQMWHNRVNDTTRQEFIAQTTSKHTAQYNNEIISVKREQVTLANEYKEYKNKLWNRFYQLKIEEATHNFFNSKFDLRPYDADNETFLIHSDSYGDILLPVPIEEAPSFKQNWSSIQRNIRPEFVPNGEEVALNKLTFSNNGNEYTYDSHTIANYAITDVDYNFAPVEIAEINLSDIKIVGIGEIPAQISSTVIGLKNSSDILTPNSVKPSVKHITASVKSNVDVAIPDNSKLVNPTTFAVIIANEEYNSVSPVQYAENDGLVFSKYLEKTLGLPTEHVKIYNNATYGNMAAALKHINNLSLAFGNNLNLILYYAGHGVPNEQTKRCMLLPIDGDAQIPETCYEIDKLYANLGKLNAKSVVVIMDACFSGSLRGDGMLYASRSVKIKSSVAEPKGNMVILSASQGDETAYPLDKEQHGMFTYYLLKCLQENKGNITLGELSDYLIEQVKRQSVVSNGKLQTPMVQYSPEVESQWRMWKLVQ